MKVFKSVCTNLFFPRSRGSIDEFRKMAEFVAAHGVQGIEFYHDADGEDRVGRVLSDCGLDGVYISVIPLKEKLKHLCCTDESNREEAVALVRHGMDLAADNGMGTVMVNSGRIEPGRENEQMEALVRSMDSIFEYRAQKGYTLGIEMEPCDSGMDARQFIGPWRRTKELLERLDSAGLGMRLTMDSAHTAEEWEDFPEAVAALKPWCSHVHYANCRISNAQDPLYGDKHLGYEYPDTVWGFDALDTLTAKLNDLYPGDEHLRVGLEALCREDDPYAWFDKVWSRMAYMSR